MALEEIRVQHEHGDTKENKEVHGLEANASSQRSEA